MLRLKANRLVTSLNSSHYRMPAMINLAELAKEELFNTLFASLELMLVTT